MQNHRLFALLCLALLWLAPSPGLAQSGTASLAITDRGSFVVFPDRVSFNAQIRTQTPVKQIVLEYGVDKRTCGDVVAKIYPKFTPGSVIDVNWTWEMKQTGSEPPGATIWYRWRVIDQNGNSAVTPDARVTWLDSTYGWQHITQGDLTLHWYAGSRPFADDLLATTVDGIEQLARLTGVRPQAPIHLYIYGDTQEMQDAILYEPSWTGGVAFPANNITIIGIAPAQLDWGKRTIVHELTHLIVGQMTFSCGENVPTWLDEGIAVFAEGGLDPYSAARFERAVAANELLSVRAISNGFSSHPDIADLSYSQSYSLVRYLVEAHGAPKLLALFENLRAGLTVEAGLQQAYGFDLDGLEDRWRNWLGAARRDSQAPTASPPRAPLPTYAPIAVAPTGPARAPTATGAAGAVAAASDNTAVAALATRIVPAPPDALAASPAPARPAAGDPRLLGAALVFVLGLGLVLLASWKLFATR